MWEEQKSDSLASAACEPLFCSFYIMTSYCVSITEQTTAKSYLFVKYNMVWYGMVWHGMAWHGMAWHGMVWYGMVWYGMVWYGMVW
jgi:hypothetical protein